MLLAVDIGNSNIVLGLYEDSTLLHTFRVASERARSADEYAVLLLELLALQGVAKRTVNAAIIGSVVPVLSVALGQAIERAFGVEALQVSPALNLGMPVLYDTPRELGVDRLLNAVAAFERVNGPAIVVDFGTATKLDCVSPKGEYLGGAIAPGLRTSLDALIERAAKLSQVELCAPPRTLGRNTTQALQSGLIFGHAALVDGLIDRLELELGYACRVIATGGLSGLIAGHAKRVNELAPNLTLEGLRILHARNAAPTHGTQAP